MRKGILAGLAVLGALTLQVPAAAAKDAAFNDSAFSAMLEKAYAGDATADLTWMRQQNMQRFHYHSPDWDKIGDAFKALDSDAAKALELAEDHLRTDPLSLYAHYVAEVALEKLGKPAESARHHNLMVAYLNSATANFSDGATAATAWNAVSVDEEYALFDILGFKPGSQALVNDGGHTYDLMSVTETKSGKPRQIYFNIDSYFGKEFEGMFD